MCFENVLFCINDFSCLSALSLDYSIIVFFKNVQ